ncbi:MAG: hypothetical protein SOY32_10265, partial [Candidatus Faecousia sp.]|nr:hypothetical protein [Candidatus Faecousia sp.]
VSARRKGNRTAKFFGEFKKNTETVRIRLTFLEKAAPVPRADTWVRPYKQGRAISALFGKRPP